MRIGVPKESVEGERRVALVPDGLYADAGATIGDPWGAEVIVKVAPPAAGELSRLSSGTTLIGFLNPRGNPDGLKAVAATEATAFAMEAIPRISRAQSMDALSSQSNVSGYKAALLGAEHSTRFHPMLMTAAGTIPPAKVLVLGIGVAGLQALATARRPRAMTCGPRRPSRSSRWGRSGWTSGSRRPVRAAPRNLESRSHHG